MFEMGGGSQTPHEKMVSQHGIEMQRAFAAQFMNRFSMHLPPSRLPPNIAVQNVIQYRVPLN
jgi:hypothetical protein